MMQDVINYEEQIMNDERIRLTEPSSNSDPFIFTEWNLENILRQFTK